MVGCEVWVSIRCTFYFSGKRRAHLTSLSNYGSSTSSCRGEAIGLGMRSFGCAFWIGTAYDAMMQSHFKYALNIETAFVVLVWCNRILIPVLEVRALRFGTQLGPVPNGTLNPGGPLSLHFRDVMPLWLSGRSLLRSSPCGRSRAPFWRLNEEWDTLQSRGLNGLAAAIASPWDHKYIGPSQMAP